MASIEPIKKEFSKHENFYLEITLKNFDFEFPTNKALTEDLKKAKETLEKEVTVAKVASRRLDPAALSAVIEETNSIHETFRTEMVDKFLGEKSEFTTAITMIGSQFRSRDTVAASVHIDTQPNEISRQDLAKLIHLNDFTKKFWAMDPNFKNCDDLEYAKKCFDRSKYEEPYRKLEVLIKNLNGLSKDTALVAESGRAGHSK